LTEIATKGGLSLRVPKEIKECIEKSAKAFNIAREYEKIVRDWLDSKGLENDEVQDNFIDCIENGSEQYEEFIKYLKNL
jgi:hypothetical protein